MVEDSVFVCFFAIERAGSLPESQIAWQEITKRLVSKSDFFPLRIFLACLKTRFILNSPD